LEKQKIQQTPRGTLNNIDEALSTTLGYTYTVVPDFVLHSEYAPLAVSLLVSFYKHLEPDAHDVLHPDPTDSRFVLVGDIDVHIHFGHLSALSYRVSHGSRYRMPRILFADEVA